MVRDGDSSVILFLITMFTHLALFPPMYIYYQRGCFFELSAALFGFVASFMYHTCEDFDMIIFLSERQWHRLDNIGVLTTLGVLFVFLARFTNKTVERLWTYSVVFITIIVQQKHPWDVRLTVAPLLMFFLIPVVNHCFINRYLPYINKRNFLVGVGFLGVATLFFVKGLDDDDPYRLFHGLWHFFGGISFTFLMCTFSSSAPSKSGAKYTRDFLRSNYDSL
ncbi:unnamed protein product [Phytomonas sp. EM1]|nr:unnamed protein product [Phytomonas sp. EM1]|eukprot:CCW65674.1 unnamed protein product [Phytomonas sp. isolate EM1]